MSPPATGPRPEEAPKGGSNVGGVQQDWKKVLPTFLRRWLPILLVEIITIAIIKFRRIRRT